MSLLHFFFMLYGVIALALFGFILIQMRSRWIPFSTENILGAITASACWLYILIKTFISDEN
jgi:hypothetical protein